MTKKRYETLGWPDIDALDKEHTIVMIPIGATEQHGRHLPLGTDSIDAQYLADQIAEDVGASFPLLVFPLLPVGLSIEHMHFPGSVTLQPDTLYHVALDICESLVRHGFKRIVFLNGHGGNSAILTAVSYKVRADHGVGVFLLDISVLLSLPNKPVIVQTEGFDGHAGELETALMLAAQPEAVRLERAVPTAPDRFASHQVFTLEGPVTVGWLANDLSAAGSCGNPSYASPEQGQAMLDFMTEKACTALREILTWPLDIQLDPLLQHNG